MSSNVGCRSSKFQCILQSYIILCLPNSSELGPEHLLSRSVTSSVVFSRLRFFWLIFLPNCAFLLIYDRARKAFYLFLQRPLRFRQLPDQSNNPECSNKNTPINKPINYSITPPKISEGVLHNVNNLIHLNEQTIVVKNILCQSECGLITHISHYI